MQILIWLTGLKILKYHYFIPYLNFICKVMNTEQTKNKKNTYNPIFYHIPQGTNVISMKKALFSVYCIFENQSNGISLYI